MHLDRVAPLPHLQQERVGEEESARSNLYGAASGRRWRNLDVITRVSGHLLT